MEKYNMSSIMRAAWKLFRKGVASFGLALRLAWANAKLHKMVKENAQVTEVTHTWAGWKAQGYEVRHGSAALYKVVIADPATKTGYRTKSYFGASQVQPISA